METFMKINLVIVAVSIIGTMGYFMWKGFTQWLDSQSRPSLVKDHVSGKMSREDKIYLMQNKYRNQITRMKISDFFGIKDKGCLASDKILSTKDNVIFVDFKTKKRAS